MRTSKKHNWKQHSHGFQVQKQKRRAAKIERRSKRKKSHGSHGVVKKDHINAPKPVVHSRAQEIARLFPGFKQLTAPPTFSLLNNEPATLEFLRKLKGCYNAKKKVYILTINDKTNNKS